MLVALGCGRISVETLDAEGSAGSANGSGGTSNVSGAPAGGSFASAGVGAAQAGGNSSGAVGGANAAGATSVEGGATSADAGASSADAGTGGESVICAEGLALCNGKCTDLRVGNQQGDVTLDCGLCGNSCSLIHASRSTCTAGVCAPMCQPGFASCNSTTNNDGCETPINTVDNCGECQRACSQNGALSRSCVSGQCGVTCAPRYADCNQNTKPTPNDGCETFLDQLDRCGRNCSTAGVACDPTNVCNNGSCVAPTGLTVLSVPAKKNSSGRHRFADIFPAPANLEGASITVRVYAPGATSGTLVVYPSDTTSNNPGMLTADLASLAEKWTDLTISVASTKTFNATSIKQLNLEVNLASTGSSIDPVVVYVDSIRSSNLAVSDTFDSSVGGMVSSSQVVVPGSTFTWAAAMP